MKITNKFILKYFAESVGRPVEGLKCMKFVPDHTCYETSGYIRMEYEDGTIVNEYWDIEIDMSDDDMWVTFKRFDSYSGESEEHSVIMHFNNQHEYGYSGND